MTHNYWPWWLGGGFLALTAILYPLLTGDPLGVSGALGRVLRRYRHRTDDSARAESGCGEAQQAGEQQSTPDLGTGASCCGPASTGCGPGDSTVGASDQQRSERRSSAVFLLSMAVGGGLAEWAGGQTWGRGQLASEFYRLYGHGAGGWVALFVGGILVGVGTRLSGGCTSGHGLSGCGRLQPASLVATAVFFGFAIAVSFLIEGLLS